MCQQFPFVLVFVIKDLTYWLVQGTYAKIKYYLLKVTEVVDAVNTVTQLQAHHKLKIHLNLTYMKFASEL